MQQRKLIKITGSDRFSFLQGLITNDVKKLDDGPIYAALLTPQGKLIADFLLSIEGEAILLDVAGDYADHLERRLSMYRLRADVHIIQDEREVFQGIEEAPQNAIWDPRHKALGWRTYGDTPNSPPLAKTEWDALRVKYAVPELGIELTEDSYILEASFERLSGVDHSKGCYVGQEVTSRMYHKTTLRKGLARVRISGSAPVGSHIFAEDGREAGKLYTQSNGGALAYLRFDRAKGALHAGDGAEIIWDGAPLE